MKCKCGYSGDAEYGTFPDTKMAFTHHIRCPTCKSSRHIIIMPEERIKMAILYPEYCCGSVDYGKHEKTKKVIEVHPEGYYSIYCPMCQWGEGGGVLPEDKTKELLQLLHEKIS